MFKYLLIPLAIILLACLTVIIIIAIPFITAYYIVELFKPKPKTSEKEQGFMAFAIKQLTNANLSKRTSNN
jgi:hypothetical protein